MKWLIALETNDDPISACRLMNIFRRKGLRITTLALAPRPGGFTLLALVDFAESDCGHLFHFLRRTGGVEAVSFYRHEASGDASFVWVETGAGSEGVAEILKALSKFELIFAGQGKYLLKIPPGSPVPASIAGAETIAFARVMGSERLVPPEPVAALS